MHYLELQNTIERAFALLHMANAKMSAEMVLELTLIGVGNGGQ